MALHAVNAFETELTAVDVETVEAVLGEPHDVSVHTVFIAHVAEHHVAVAAVEGNAAVIRVLAVGVHDRHARNFPMQLDQLIKEWTL